MRQLLRAFGITSPEARSVNTLSWEELERLKPRHDTELATHISLKNKFVFFQVSKAASSTVKYFLQKREFEGTRFKVQNVNNKHLAPHLSPYQLGDPLFFDILQRDDFRRVCIVRNPYIRTLSCYLHRIVSEPHSASAKWLRRCTGWTERKTPSFSEFVRFICNQESRDMERHWRVQSDDILWDMVRMSFVAKVEALPDDLIALGEHLFPPLGFDNEGIEGMDASPMTTKSAGKVKMYYDDVLTDLIRDRFHKDFVNFGYADDLPG